MHNAVVVEPTNRPFTDRPTDRPTDQPTNQPRPTDRPTDRPTNQPTRPTRPDLTRPTDHVRSTQGWAFLTMLTMVDATFYHPITKDCKLRWRAKLLAVYVGGLAIVLICYVAHNCECEVSRLAPRFIQMLRRFVATLTPFPPPSRRPPPATNRVLCRVHSYAIFRVRVRSGDFELYLHRVQQPGDHACVRADAGRSLVERW